MLGTPGLQATYSASTSGHSSNASAPWKKPPIAVETFKKCIPLIAVVANEKGKASIESNEQNLYVKMPDVKIYLEANTATSIECKIKALSLFYMQQRLTYL